MITSNEGTLDFQFIYQLRDFIFTGIFGKCVWRWKIKKTNEK